MPENHFMANATLVWMTSGIFGVTIEGVNPSIPITTYNITRLIEVEPAYAPSRFREAHVLVGQQWIGIELAVVFGSIFVYQITERLKKDNIKIQNKLEQLFKAAYILKIKTKTSQI